MRKALPGILVTGMLLLASPLVQAELRQLSSGEITSLFDNKTAEAYHSRQGFSFIAYYTEAGTITGLHKGRFFSSQWTVNDRDQICILFPALRGLKKDCFFVLQDGKETYFYTSSESGSESGPKSGPDILPAYTFTGFASGNPNRF